MPGFSVSLHKELYKKVLNLEDDEGKTTSGIISEILEVCLNKKLYSKLFQMKKDKNTSFAEVLNEILQKGLQE